MTNQKHVQVPPLVGPRKRGRPFLPPGMKKARLVVWISPNLVEYVEESGGDQYLERLLARELEEMSARADY